MSKNFLKFKITFGVKPGANSDNMRCTWINFLKDKKKNHYLLKA